jgi:C1A family cysteine protease
MKFSKVGIISDHQLLLNTRSLKIILFLFILLIFCGLIISDVYIPRDQSGRSVLGNPAAVYCREMGFSYETISGEDGQYGVCHFSDTESCEAWDFLQGTCGEEHSYCAQQGYEIKTRNDGKDPFSPSYSVCISNTGEEIGTVTELSNLTEKSLGCQDEEYSIPRDEVVLDGTFTATDGAPPASFDWRNNSGNWLTDVKDQGICGSCWAFAAVGVAEAIFNLDAGNPALDLDLSEQYLVSDCDTSSGDCCGGYTNSALSYLRDYGVPDESCLPYVDGGISTGCSCSYDIGLGYYTCDVNCTYSSYFQCSDTTCSDRCGDWETRREFITDVGSVSSDPLAIKQALIDKGPLAVALDMSGDFDGMDVFRCPIEDGYTNHAVNIVGYDDAGGYWIVRNSWGNTWNGDGYFHVGYGECSIEEYVYYADYDSGISGPANDDMADAIDILPASLPYSTTQDTTGATMEEGEPYSYCAPGNASVWYTFTPSSTGLYQVDTYGSGYDTVLDIYEDLGGGSYLPISCNDQDDEYWSNQSWTVFLGEAGTTYYIGILEYSGFT